MAAPEPTSRGADRSADRGASRGRPGGGWVDRLGLIDELMLAGIAAELAWLTFTELTTMRASAAALLTALIALSAFIQIHAAVRRHRTTADPEHGA